MILRKNKKIFKTFGVFLFLSAKLLIRFTILNQSYVRVTIDKIIMKKLKDITKQSETSKAKEFKIVWYVW